MSPRPPTESIKEVVTHLSLSFFFTMTEHVFENEVRVEKKTRKKKTSSPKKACQKRIQLNHSQVSPKRIKKKREMDQPLQDEKPKKVIHLMIYPVHGIILWSHSPMAKIQRMLTEMVKDWLGRQVWRNADMSEKNSHLAHEYGVEQLDPAGIFLYQVANPPFTVFHFVAHMVIMRNALPWERYRRHRQLVFTERRQHVPTFKKLLVAQICSLFKTK